MRKLTVILAICYAIIVSLNCAAQVNKKSLGQKPGLGSDCFILVDTIFNFKPSLKVEGKIYYQEYAKRYQQKPIGEEKRFPVSKVSLACDTFVLNMEKNGDAYMINENGDTIPYKLGGLSAIKISPDNRWHTMYGETQIFGDSTEIKELGGSGKKDGYFYAYFCPTEQPCFSLRVKAEKEKELIAEIKKLYALWYQVGVGAYNRPKN